MWSRRVAIVAVLVFGMGQTPTPISPILDDVSGTAEETNPDIHYVGSWWNYAHASCSAGNFYWTGNDSNSLSFSFIGSGFALYVSGESGTHTFDVCIDGSCVEHQTVTVSSVCSKGYVSGDIGNGLHVVQVLTSNASSLWWGFDSVTYWRAGEEPVESVVSGTLESGSYYEVSRSASFGEMMIGLMLMVVCVLILVSIFVSVVYGKRNQRNR